MKTIAIVKDPEISHNGMRKVFTEGLSEHQVTTYHYKQLIFLYKNKQTPDLLILEKYKDRDIDNILDYSSKHQTKLAVCTSSIEKGHLMYLFNKGFDGYFYDDMEKSEFLFAIDSILNEKQYIHPKLSSVLLKDYLELINEEANRPINLLTKREWDVLEQIVHGNNNESIAENLYISPRTVKNHITSILKKLSVPDRTNAALLAIKQKWFIL